MISVTTPPTTSETASAPGATPISPRECSEYGRLAHEAEAVGTDVWFRREVQPYEPALRAYLHSRFSTIRDFDDVIQDTYLRLWCARSKGPIRSVSGLLFATARNAAIDFIRRQRASRIVDVTREQASLVHDEAEGAIERVTAAEQISLLAAAIETLPPRCRETLKLRQQSAMSCKEIAVQLRVSARTVDNQLRHGFRRCEEYINARDSLAPRAPRAASRE